MATEPSLVELPPHHKEALQKLYAQWGVGETEEQKHAFWNAREPSTFISHLDFDDPKRVLVFELSYLSDVFPEDFQHC